MPESTISTGTSRVAAVNPLTEILMPVPPADRNNNLAVSVQKKKRHVEELGQNIRQHRSSNRWFSIPLQKCLCFNVCMNGNDSNGGTGLLDENFMQWQKELADLPPEEQDRLHQDMYGETPTIHETPDMVQEKLDQLAQVLHALPPTDVEAYVLAMEQAQEKKELDVDGAHVDDYYIASQDFHIMFLRSTNWDVIQAAGRLGNFMQLKRELFGQEKLSKKITLADLSEDDRASLKAGCGTFCGTDAAGRTLMCQRQQWYTYKEIDNLVRAMYYVRMEKVENSLSTQQKGIVGILYNVGYYAGHQKEAVMRAVPRITQLHVHGPFKIVAIHHCHNNFVEWDVWSVLRAVCPKKVRVTYNRISGDDQECLIKLMTFGIPVEQLNHEGWYPIGSDDMRNDDLEIFSKKRAQSDDMDTDMAEDDGNRMEQDVRE